MLDIQEKSNGLIFKISVLPKSSKNGIAGLYNHSIKIKLTVAPVDGSANKLCIIFLSKELNITKSSIEIVSGFKNRNKQILIHYKNDTYSDEEKNFIVNQIEKLIN